MNLKHIYWFAYFNVSEPSVRYRGYYALQQLHKNHGISYSFVYPAYQPGIIWNFFKVYFAALLFRRKNSLLVIQKVYTRGFYAIALKLLVKVRAHQTVYDIDDAEYLRRPADSVHYFLRNCAWCSVGSNELEQYARHFNKRVVPLTSPVLEQQSPAPVSNPVFTIGWIGYYNAHRDSLQQLLFPALKNLQKPVSLVLLGVVKPEHVTELNNYFADMPWVHLQIDKQPVWLNEAEVYQYIRQFDLGIAPLLDTPFNRAKSAFKMKQCLACGVPVLASPVGENQTFLQHGQNGFFCQTPLDFENRIRQFMDMSKEERQPFRQAAYNSRERFSYNGYCNTLLTGFNS